MTWSAFRRGLQFVHLWAGLILCIPIVLIGVSGAIIVVTHVIRDYSAPSAPARGELQPIASILEVARGAAPEGWRVSSIILPSRAGQPAAAQVSQPREDRGANLQGLTIYVDPVSLEVIDTAERRRSGEFMRNLVLMHVALMAPRHYGLQTVGFLGIAMVLFGLTGLVLWWPRRGQWRFAFGVRRGARGFVLNRDLHSAAGFWGLIVFVIVSLSGVMLSFPMAFESVVGRILPMENRLTSATIDDATLAGIANPNALTPDDAVRIALSAVPNSRAREVHVPQQADGAYMVTLKPEPFDDRAPDISAFIAPGPEILDIVDPRNNSSGRQLLIWLRLMHYGWGLGEVWRFLVFLSGLLPVLFAITGFRMWWLKRAQRRAIPAALAQPAE